MPDINTLNNCVEEREDELHNVIEALLFVLGDPVGIDELAYGLCVTEIEVANALEKLRESYDARRRGIALRYINGKAQLCTRARYSKYIEMMLQPEKNITFSQSVIETLSIIAYKQPITKSEIEAIRGVRCEYAIQQLLSLNLIESLGRKQTVGRPSLYGTTEKFLQTFGISSIDELPNKNSLLEIEIPSLTV